MGFNDGAGGLDSQGSAAMASGEVTWGGGGWEESNRLGEAQSSQAQRIAALERQNARLRAQLQEAKAGKEDELELGESDAAKTRARRSSKLVVNKNGRVVTSKKGSSTSGGHQQGSRSSRSQQNRVG